jgi:hypothetical protein
MNRNVAVVAKMRRSETAQEWAGAEICAPRSQHPQDLPDTDRIGWPGESSDSGRVTVPDLAWQAMSSGLRRNPP